MLRRVPDAEAAAVAASLGGYLGTLSEDRLPLLARYAVHDVAFRVVGTGSVGTRSYVVLLLDHRGEPLVLQVKEARPSALLPHLAAAGFEVPEVEHEGRRVVLGQKRMQVVSDILLGWTTVDGRPVPGPAVPKPQGQRGPGGAGRRPDRRLRADDRRAAGPGARAQRRSRGCSPATAARTRSWTRRWPAFAVAYADRTEADHAELVAAVRAGGSRRRWGCEGRPRPGRRPAGSDRMPWRAGPGVGRR